MNVEGMPIIRLEVDRLKYSIVSAMGIRGSELEEKISQSVDKAIMNFDFDGEVRSVFDKVMKTEIHNYFSYGKGAESIRVAIKEAFQQEIDNNE